MDTTSPLHTVTPSYVGGWPVSVSIRSTFDALFVFRSVCDEHRRVVDFEVAEVNQGGLDFLDLPTSVVMGAKFTELFANGPLAQDLKTLIEVLDSQGAFEEERIEIKESQAIRNYRIQYSPAGDSVFAAISDISSRKEAKRVLVENQGFIERLAQAFPEFVHVMDANETVVTFQNRDFLVELGYLAATGTNALLSLGDLVHPDDAAGYLDHRREVLASKYDEIFAVTCRIPTAMQEWRWFQIRTSVFRRDELGVPLELLRTIQDVSEQIRTEIDLREKIRQLRVAQFELRERQEQLQQLNQQLAALATTDGLTSLYNYRAFHEKLAEETRRAKRYGHPLSIVLADIDDFKAFNDRHGHPAGDERLRQFARLLRSCSRDSDFVARYGGEEFAMILVDTDADSAAIYAQGIVDCLNEETGPMRITASFGCVDLEPVKGTKDDMIKRADECLYSAKHQGKNRVVVSAIGTKTVGTSA